MRSALKLAKAFPVIGAGIASCPWWVVALVAAITLFLYGAEPTMRWLDVLDRLSRRKPRQRRKPH